ncbi:unnamed protein product, partial [Trichogramma brassicae]
MYGYLYFVKNLFKVVCRIPISHVRKKKCDSKLHLALLYGKKKVAECLMRRGRQSKFSQLQKGFNSFAQ